MDRTDRIRPGVDPARRALLQAFGAGALGAALPRGLRAASRPDVVVVGAGAAGIACARALTEHGFAVRVLEAAHRTGGRAWTDSTTLGVPFDRGASWISSADANPHTGVAREQGIELIDYGNAVDSLFVDGREATRREYLEYLSAFDHLSDAIARTAADGHDMAASAVVPDVAFARTAQTWTGPLDMAVDYDALSTVDYNRTASSLPLYLVSSGYGDLIARLARGVAVEHGAPVSQIDWGGQGVRVRSASGTLRARACVVTVSTGVLGADRIRFEPGLPDGKREAIRDLPMGVLEKIVLEFDGTRLGLPDDSWLTYKVSGEMPAEACFFQCWPAGQGLMVGFVGGRFGAELLRAGPDVAIDFALGELRRMLGGAVDRHFVRGAVTGWNRWSGTLGAYAAARPGAAGARDELGRPLGDRVFFAGEACGGAHVGTCGGAAMSGGEVAERVARVLG